LTVLAVSGERPARARGRESSVLIVGDPVVSRAQASMAATASVERPTELFPPGAERRSLLPGGVAPARIPSSGEEAPQVAALYHTQALLGEAATEAAVRRRISDASVVHFATHGYFNQNLPMSSGVLLTTPPGEGGGEPANDGALQAWEFGRTLPLSAELVVL